MMYLINKIKKSALLLGLSVCSIVTVFAEESLYSQFRYQPEPSCLSRISSHLQHKEFSSFLFDDLLQCDTENGEIERAFELLERDGISINHKNFSGKTWLHGILTKHPDEVENLLPLIQKLLEHGADLDVRADYYQGTALDNYLNSYPSPKPTREQKLDLFELIIEWGNPSPQIMETILKHELEWNKPRYTQEIVVIEKAILAGARPDRYTLSSFFYSNITPQRLKLRLTRFLLDQELLLEELFKGIRHSSFYERDLDEAMRAELDDKALQTGAEPLSRDSDPTFMDYKATPKTEAKLYGAPEDIDAYQIQVDLNQQLIEAARDKDLERVQELLGLGADINVEDGFFPETPLHAVFKKYPYCDAELVDALIKAGADVNMLQYELYHSPLHLAVSNNCTDAAKALIKAGAEVNTTNLSHETPLSLAVGKGHQHITQILIDAGADANGQDSLRGPSLQKAISEGYPEIARKLVKAGADVNEDAIFQFGIGKYPLPKAITMANAYLELVKELIEAEAEMNQQDPSHGYRMLDSVTDPYLREILVEAGAEEGEDKWAHRIAELENQNNRPTAYYMSFGCTSSYTRENPSPPMSIKDFTLEVRDQE